MNLPEILEYLKAALRGTVQWVAEAIIGVIPLAVYAYIHQFSNLPITAICSDGGSNASKLSDCKPIIDSPSQEICILAVVISGLAVLSVVRYARHEPRQITGFTLVLVLLALLALIFGSLSYGLFTAHLDKNADAVTYAILVSALLSSLCLSIEGAILAT
jgi:glucan phosphoethanolaminetransferase (alkaline phosphatase superfamily)